MAEMAPPDIFTHILNARPSMAQLRSFVGLRHRHPLLASASSTSPSFKSLPRADVLNQQNHFPARQVTDGSDADCTGDENDRRTLQRLTVVLDLDETLVCAYETSTLPSLIRNQATEAGLNWFEIECISSNKEIDGKPKINNVTVFERPRLQEFLRGASEFADLVLFTAGLEGYARPLVDKIDLENIFSFRLYRHSTVSTEYREHVKDLSCISQDLGRIVIIDNNPFSFLLQPTNGIPCVPFSATQFHDAQLLEVLLPLLKDLSEAKDVRRVLYERFQMPEWFEKQGIPATYWTSRHSSGNL